MFLEKISKNMFLEKISKNMFLEKISKNMFPEKLFTLESVDFNPRNMNLFEVLCIQ